MILLSVTLKYFSKMVKLSTLKTAAMGKITSRIAKANIERLIRGLDSYSKGFVVGSIQ